MRQFILWCTCALALLTTASVYADNTPTAEEIALFDSAITVQTDASITVNEKIKVYANGNKIKRGLVRTLPKVYTDSYGITRNNSYELISVTVNGAASPYHIDESRKKFAIYVGAENHHLTPGWYTYQLRYHVKHAVNFLKDADELYWNVTGNDWAFPIQKATATVTLPPGTSVTYFRGYTGHLGEKGLNYTPTQMAPDIINFETTATLPPGSGFTVALAWPKGIVIEPTMAKRMSDHITTNPGSYMVIKIAIITFLYFLLVWQMYGVDPEKGAIFPRFSPPENMSPAQARYLINMSFDIKNFTASIIALATRGLLTIKNDSSGFTLLRSDKKATDTSEEEHLILGKLFNSSNKLEVTNKNRATFNQAQEALAKLLKKRNQGKYFVTNSRLVIPGIILFIFAALAATASAQEPPVAGFMILWLSVWTAATYTLLYQAWVMLKSYCSNKTIKGFLVLLGAFLFTLPFVGGVFLGLFFLAGTIPIFTIPFLFLIATLNAVFYILLKQPTDEGRKLMDEIEGFQMYLDTTEKHRLASYAPPQMTEELFEKYLPYAIALDVENSWGQQFNQALSVAGKSAESYHPAWYSGTTWSSSTPVAFGAIIGSGLSSALTSTTASSSASGGGGSSGGGGGGGGGGGW